MMAMMDNLVPEDVEDQRLGEAPEDPFQRYYRPVIAFFMHKGFSPEESRDLAQETFFRVYKNRKKFRGDSSPATWLFQIAHNLYKNTLRGQSTQKRDADEIPIDASEELRDIRTEEEDVLRMILLQERSKLLWDALEELPPQMKKAVILRVYNDLKYREIAETMSVSIETVKAHLYQARQHLRKRLSKYFTDEEF
jgi:RNA polymerase sigma-70 factor, ECF subfamily